MRRAPLLLAAVLAAPAAASAAGPVAPASAQGPSAASGEPLTGAALARLSLVEAPVEVARREPWRRAREGQPFQPGESLRTGEGGLARLELPWMSLTLSAGSRARFPEAAVLSIALDEGRAVVHGERLETLKLVTPEAEVRGLGRAIVRREARRTLVACASGRFRVSARRGTLMLAAGQGTVVGTTGVPSPAAPLPEAPAGPLWPGRDPVYVAPDERVDLRWPGGAGPFVVELLPAGSEIVLRCVEADAPPLALAIPWPGAFRWRVSRRDGRGLESLPSAEGLIAVER